jgi:dihydrodipicolinate synthase/N-acetylneuraminate lyase
MSTSKPGHLAHGLYAALATPRRRSVAEPDTAAFLDYLDTVVRTGVDGVVLFGSTGEFVHFDVADRMHTLNLAIKRSRVPVLVNVSHSTLDGAVALADDAIGSGAAGLLLLPPYFYRYSEDDLFTYYIRFHECLAEPAPIYLYNLPQYTNAITETLAVRLLETGKFAGIKDSSGSWALFQRLRELEQRFPFQLLIGNERLYLEARTGGAHGAVSGIAAAVPELMVAMDRAIREGQNEKSAALNQHLQEFLDWVEQFPATIGIKQAAVARGWPFEHIATPLSDNMKNLLPQFRSWLSSWLPRILKNTSGVGSAQV